MNKKTKNLISLFSKFFKIGLFTFGGGYAMVPLMQRETCDKMHWISENDMFDIIAIAESTPGPIAVNSATFIGYRVAGFLGALSATLGVVLPSFIIILLVSTLYKRFNELRIVKYAFWGIRCAVIALIFKAWYSMFKKCDKKVVSIIIMAFSLLFALFTNINVIYLIIGGGLTGFIYSICKERRKHI